MLVEVAGWIGTFLVLLAYFLVSLGKLDAQGKIFQSMNLFGALGLGVNVFAHRAWPNFALNIVWGFIAVVALCKFYRAKK